MPDTSVVIPTVAVPADRLTLGVTDARQSLASIAGAGGCYAAPPFPSGCMSEE